ncbi:MAG: hypothetical protein K2P26_02185, partial [Oscillospiraceae bacterium]|nr:hypothetical protein [Oscillospiraceae bacterium]
MPEKWRCGSTAKFFLETLSFKKKLEPVFTTVERCLASLFPAILRRFPLQSVRILQQAHRAPVQ